jgi:hypothetical protein
MDPQNLDADQTFEESVWSGDCALYTRNVSDRKGIGAACRQNFLSLWQRTLLASVERYPCTAPHRTILSSHQIEKSSFYERRRRLRLLGMCHAWWLVRKSLHSRFQDFGKSFLRLCLKTGSRTESLFFYLEHSTQFDEGSIMCWI